MLLEKKTTLSNREIYKLDGYFRAANYLSVGQLYLLSNSLLKSPLTIDDIKVNVVGHWGTVPGQNFIITHLNRIIKKNDLDMILIVGPGHGGNAAVSNCYLEGTYSKYYKNITEDESGMQKLFKQFSFPKGISSHVAPETPGSIHEGGELGYSLAHAFGAALDNPDLIVSTIVGDGEAETGPLATSWHLNKILNPKTDGIVLPILHLNGYKISNPTILSRIPRSELKSFLKGCGWNPYFVEVTNGPSAHEKMAGVMDQVVKDIKTIKKNAMKKKQIERPIYPMIVFISKKGWTGPKVVEERVIEGTFRAHQVPVVIDRMTGKNLNLLEAWLKSYRPEELFDQEGKLKEIFKSVLPPEEKRLFNRPYTNGGLLLKELKLPDYRKYALKVKHGNLEAQDMTVLATFLRDVIKENQQNHNFKLFAPDETLSNRMAPLFEATTRRWNGVTFENDEYLANGGDVIDSVLSEHICEGMLEGYILTGRHGIFDSYEAFIRVVDSMISQHAKWLKVTSELPWRKSISSLNLLLTSHCWQQDHNGYTHQDPGLLNHIATKKPEIARMYLPPDANTLLSTIDHCLRTKNYINVIVASKHPRPQWLNVKEAEEHCIKGVGVWEWASTCSTLEPDIVLASAGDTPTLEVLAAISILHKYIPKLKIRMINVVDLMKLTSNTDHPHGLTDKEYDKLFTKNKHIIFAFHGYPSLIHELTYKRTNQNMHVHGYNEEGTITTPFDMRVQNKIDRYHLILDVIKYVDKYKKEEKILKKYCEDMLKKHESTIGETGLDIDEVRTWKWVDFDSKKGTTKKKKVNLGTEIRNARKKKNITQTELADMLMVSRKYISELENNVEEPTATIIKKLKTILGIDLTK